MSSINPLAHRQVIEPPSDSEILEVISRPSTPSQLTSSTGSNLDYNERMSAVIVKSLLDDD